MWFIVNYNWQSCDIAYPCTCSHLSLELICSALANILAPMSPMAFPLMSNLVSEELLPRAFKTMVRSLFSLESARDREVRGWGFGEKEGSIYKGGRRWKEKSVERGLILREQEVKYSHMIVISDLFVTDTKAGQSLVYLPPAGCSIESDMMNCPPVLCLFSFGITSKQALKKCFSLVVYHCQC